MTKEQRIEAFNNRGEIVRIMFLERNDGRLGIESFLRTSTCQDLDQFIKLLTEAKEIMEAE